MRTQPIRHNERGYVLIVALTAMVVLSVAATAVYRTSETQLMMTNAVKNQAIAAQRAAFGAKMVVAEINASPPPAYLNALLANFSNCSATTQVWGPNHDGGTPYLPSTEDEVQVLASRPEVDNGTAITLEQGGGSQYQVDIVCIHRNVRPNVPAVIVRSFGFYGYNPATRAGSSRFMDVVEVEINLLQFQGTSGNAYGNVGQ